MKAKASDLFFRLMEATTGLGIEQCRGALWRDAEGESIPSIRHGGAGYCCPVREPHSVCVNGLHLWGANCGTISREEQETVQAALPAHRVSLNNYGGWTFPDFYTYLKDKEDAVMPSTEQEPVAVAVNNT